MKNFSAVKRKVLVSWHDLEEKAILQVDFPSREEAGKFIENKLAKKKVDRVEVKVITTLEIKTQSGALA